ncbi:ATP-binding cassette domain-containing protein [Lentilactobacillus raoultii]|uniref:ATP-binding cassette domain-containing protein n=1 Tax=Lentilactobacillus raoultii TaxID=1987503 RepID=A0ABW3PHM5_9LACO|nr:ABC transporter ATP-binding protein [Lentilactobacillus raoultii]
MLKINNLTLKTRVPILNDFNYQFEPGQIYLITAINGSGKTTFFRALTDLIKRPSGSILFDDQPFRQAKQRVFFYETSNWFDGDLSGIDYLKFVKGQWRSTQDLTAEISFWKMTSYINLPIKKYSLGMKQRLLIAMYFCSNATYLMMDEISNGLDEESRNLLYHRLKDEAITNHRCMIMSSHYKSDAGQIADHILRLANLTMKEETK